MRIFAPIRAWRVAAAALFFPMLLLAQGPLVPPGPPGPTMKSLSEIEPRTAISSLPFTIGDSGSYYLTTNLAAGGSAGIFIKASDVTIDLQGFTISDAKVGIGADPTVERVVIRNGTVRGCAIAGIDLTGVHHGELEQVLVLNTVGDGVIIGESSLINRCQSVGNSGVGISVGSASSVTRCIVRSNSSDGLRLDSDCYASENIADRNGATTTDAGILVTGNGNRIEANTMSANTGRGLRVTGVDNLVVKNSARGNTGADFDIVAGNNYGQIISSPGANFVVNNAWANFSTTCPSGQVLCGGVCASTSTDPNNCGACNNVCPDAQNADPACNLGVCGIVCDAGYGNCNGSSMDGCEIDLSTDPSNCGQCGNSCGTGTCSAGVCSALPCTNDMDCAPNGFCSGGNCTPKLNVGQMCTYSGQCASGICMNGICQSGGDADGDGVSNATDNCPNLANPSQADQDMDARGDVCDNCPNTSNPAQTDTDNDGIGDACEACNPTGPEVCDGVDNDCNGMIDDGLGSTTCGTGACQRTQLNCVGGVPQSCTPGSPTSEVCDNADNDCDGQVDENFGNINCGVGACSRSVPSCSNGMPQTCVPGSPSPEVCDGMDNDCDGTTDEGNPGGGAACSTGIPGICASGTTSCQSGALTCVQNSNATTEICNGVDDDCDGTTDEGNPGGGAACNTGQVGVCAAGTTACTGGAISCIRNVDPSAEICNGVDEDCDGMTDEGASCPGGQTCISGACKKLTGVACTTNTECASAFCVDGVCCNSACNSLCKACNIAGSVGTCTNIPAGQDPANECSGLQVCNGAGACQ